MNCDSQQTRDQQTSHQPWYLLLSYHDKKAAAGFQISMARGGFKKE
jgi:hypothetical protein